MGRCNDDIQDTLEHNIGKLCTVFTISGGDEGFTGIVSEVDDVTCRLISPYMFEDNGDGCGCNRRRRNGYRYGNGDDYINGRYHRDYGQLKTIPLSKITCVSSSQI